MFELARHTARMTQRSFFTFAAFLAITTITTFSSATSAQSELPAPPPAEAEAAEAPPAAAADPAPPAEPADDPPVVPDPPPPPPQVVAPPTGYGVPAQEAPPILAPAPVPPEEQDVRYMDANADRVILFSTAETHPEGTFFFTDYELVLLQFGYAITDELQLALTGLPPMFDDQPYLFALSLKLNVARGERFRAALMGSIDYINIDSDNYIGGRLGGVAQVCFGRTCQSSLNLNAQGFINDSTSDFLPVLTALGFVGHVSSLFSILLEPSYAFVIGDSVDDADGFLLSYGVRLSGANWGLDLTFVRPFADGYDALIMGVPWLAFTYRTDGDRTNTNPPGGPLASQSVAY